MWGRAGEPCRSRRVDVDVAFQAHQGIGAVHAPKVVGHFVRLFLVL